MKINPQTLPFADGKEQFHQSYYPATHAANSPRAVNSPGEIIGSTRYDYQSNGTISKQVAVDSNCGTHFCWMNGLNYSASDRHVYYNFVNEDGNRLSSTGVQVDHQVNRAGYCSMDLTSDDRAVNVFHQRDTSIGNFYSVVVVNKARGTGNFTVYPINGTLPATEQPIWLQVAVDNLNYFQVVATPSTDTEVPHVLYYSKSTDLGITWSEWSVIDITKTVSYTVATAYGSGKVGIAFCHLTVGNNYLTQPNNDIFYMESIDNGTTCGMWQNLTNFTEPAHIAAYCDLEIIFDQNDQYYIVFSADSIYNDILMTYSSYYYIMYYTPATGLTMVSDIGWHDINTPTGDPGVWQLVADRPSIGEAPVNNIVHCVFVYNDVNDISASNWLNVEC